MPRPHEEGPRACAHCGRKYVENATWWFSRPPATVEVRVLCSPCVRQRALTFDDQGNVVSSSTHRPVPVYAGGQQHHV